MPNSGHSIASVPSQYDSRLNLGLVCSCKMLKINTKNNQIMDSLNPYSFFHLGFIAHKQATSSVCRLHSARPMMTKQIKLIGLMVGFLLQ